MPNAAISALPVAVAPLGGGDLLVTVQGLVTRRTTLAELLDSVPDGAAVAPGLAFGGEVNSGFYRAGLRNVGLALGGALALSVSSPASAVNFCEIVAGTMGAPGRVQVRAAGADANVSLVVSPKGTGALLGQFPDNAASGGNGRGAGAVDWQTGRSAATQVASGVRAFIGGGEANTASGSRATVCGGDSNTASSTNSFVGGGVGNTASNSHATVAGGQSNSATQLRATVGGGALNTASGQLSTVAGGSANTASGLVSVVAGGSINTANGASSWCPGGTSATTRGIFGRGAWAAGQIAAPGDAQCGEHPMFRQTTDATATRMTAEGGAPGATNTINMPNFSAYAGTLTVVAKAAGGTAAATWRVQVSAVRGNGAGTVVVYEGAGTAIIPTASNGTGSAWRLDIAADTTNGGIAVTVTGAAATTINHSARFSNVEAVTAS